ncbi:hypothetical protein HNGLIVSP_CDS0067 [Escherichia phage 241]|uniref:Uncharacterized protein n=3 Tax=Kuttervirus TaxID=2169536 RepID=S4TTH1_9CAUD|nr:hypothetical protein FDI91_gp190 [Salmonella phage STML-13-1]AGF88510.1 hypothetical protein SP063_00285 [Salmonella phage FSL SP-063]AGF89009.1 hypothetical protein SP029_00135 [Salmonella phage FSL SP-029]AXY85299.1 hypothetical protein Mooltan_195 [Salmonella phage Mooltan]AYJ73741.1 hypothetical protein PS5_186 [Salmonella phage PS5]EBI9227040.1 hypothetical protein [Salmonella enterica]EDL7894922.1 hypothetical protein [Salmonella enterica subsp. enterica serovar Typhimurium]QEA10309
MFFEIVGVITTCVFVIITLSVVYYSFIHPIFQAISIARWLTACSLATGNKPPTLKERWSFFKWGYEIGGVRTTRYSNNIGEWYGIGRWNLFKSDEE